MEKINKAKWIRKSHRYLGLFIGIQFLMWTVSGLYFSWSDIDSIHGDQYHNVNYVSPAYTNLISPTQIKPFVNVQSIELRDINNKPYYWINKKQLYNAVTGILKNKITKQEAVAIANSNLNTDLKMVNIQLIKSTSKDHEYRERLLPAYVISYDEPNNLKAYVSVSDGKFQTVRHRDWRWFDFLWMTHTMDYEGRDNINNIVLRIFSALGLITVLSGFLLWYISSPTIRKFFKRKNKLKIK